MSGQRPQSIRKAYRPALVVLVVEDHLMFSKEIKHALPEHTVVFARSVEDAKARYDECLPNITFLDIDLPDGNGFELLDYIRAREPEAHVVILTGSKLQEDVLISRQKGACDYLLKPFTKSKIEQSVEKYLQNREMVIQLLLTETEKHRHDAITSIVQEDGN